MRHFTRLLADRDWAIEILPGCEYGEAWIVHRAETKKLREEERALTRETFQQRIERSIPNLLKPAEKQDVRRARSMEFNKSQISQWPDRRTQHFILDVPDLPVDYRCAIRLL
jgi:hypothetical protein